MISVIVPVYNTGNTLNKCLKSVVNQTYKDVEIIIVNDCSTDKKTILLISEWVKKDSRIRLIDKRINEGVDKARFSAIQQVKGDFLTFLDSDDWLETDALDSLLSVSNKNGADVVIGKMRKIYMKGLLHKNDHYAEDWMERPIFHEELMSKYYISYFGVNILPIQLCGALFRTSVVLDAKIEPSGLRFGEDLLMSLQIFPHIKCLFAVNKIVYNYNVGLPGFSDKYLNNWLENARKLYERKMQVLKEMNYDKAFYYQHAELVNYLKSYIYACCTRRPNDKEKNIVLLQNEINNPVYQNLDYLLNSRFKDKNSVNLIIKGDAAGFYSYIEKDLMVIRKNPKVFILGAFSKLYHISAQLQKFVDELVHSTRIKPSDNT